MSKCTLPGMLLVPLGVLAVIVGFATGDLYILYGGLAGALLGFALFKLGSRNGLKIMLDNSRIEYTVRPEVREAAPEDYHGVDRNFYDRTQQFFEEQGFQFLGDYTDERLELMYPSVRGVERAMQSPDGTVGVEFCKLVFPPYFALINRIFRVDNSVILLSCELDDGTFLILANQPGVARKSQPAAVHAVGMPAGTGAELLLQTFLEKRAKYLIAHPERRPRVIRSFQERQQQELRRFELVRAFREEAGLLTAQDLMANSASPQLAEATLASLRRIARPGEIR